MATFYVTEINVDRGENIHIRSEVMPVCEEEIPFEIESATWKLWDSGMSEVIEEGECEVDEHILDALVDFLDTGTFYLEFTYYIADETWVDKAKIKVG